MVCTRSAWPEVRGSIPSLVKHGLLMIPLTKKHQPQYEACECVNTQVGTDGPPTERVIFGFRYSGISGVVPQRNKADPAAIEWFSPA